MISSSVPDWMKEMQAEAPSSFIPHLSLHDLETDPELQWGQPHTGIPVVENEGPGQVLQCSVPCSSDSSWVGDVGGEVLFFTLCWCLLCVADIQMRIHSLVECFWNSLSNLWLQFPYTGNASLFGCERPSLWPWSGNSSGRHPLGAWQLKAIHLLDIRWAQEARSSCCARLQI